MDTRIQFRVDEETKRLAQQMAESQGRTLSDACRELTENWLINNVKPSLKMFG
ncbi:type II toxin-antitoxin system TacA family antitoxin [Oceanisphaera avium]|uniref:hypothetical protein n=1 Tax=Oceanisphaera avium TaxID=1903694 RepID=UPI0018DF649F